jgi:hypothetical protein
MTKQQFDLPWVLEPSFKKCDVDIVMKHLMDMCTELRDSVNKNYDWSWTLGTKKHGWAVNCIEQLICKQKYSFLGSGRQGVAQVFTVNGVAVAIVTDNSQHRRKKHRYIPSSYEQHQFSLFDEGKSIATPVIWRFIVDVTITADDEVDVEFNYPIQISLVGLKDGDIVSSYSLNDILIPKVIQHHQHVTPIELPKESQSKPVKLVRKKAKNNTKQAIG